MARSYAKIKSAAWLDDEFRSLPINAQWLYFALISQRTISFAGVIPLQARKWSGLAIDADANSVADALSILSERRYVIVDEDTEELLVRSFIRHDESWPNGNFLKAIVSAIAEIESPALREAAQHELDRTAGNHQVERPPNAVDKDVTNAVDKTVQTAMPTQDTVHRTQDTDSADTSAPQTTAGRERDPVYDALIAACGMDYAEMTAKQRRATGVARAELVKVGATPRDIHARAAVYVKKFPNAALTPHALANNWASLCAVRKAHIDQTNGAQMAESAIRA